MLFNPVSFPLALPLPLFLSHVLPSPLSTLPESITPNQWVKTRTTQPEIQKWNPSSNPSSLLVLLPVVQSIYTSLERGWIRWSTLGTILLLVSSPFIIWEVWLIDELRLTVDKVIRKEITIPVQGGSITAFHYLPAEAANNATIYPLLLNFHGKSPLSPPHSPSTTTRYSTHLTKSQKEAT